MCRPTRFVPDFVFGIRKCMPFSAGLGVRGYGIVPAVKSYSADDRRSAFISKTLQLSESKERGRMLTSKTVKNAVVLRYMFLVSSWALAVSSSCGRLVCVWNGGGGGILFVFAGSRSEGADTGEKLKKFGLIMSQHGESFPFHPPVPHIYPKKGQPSPDTCLNISHRLMLAGRPTAAHPGWSLEPIRNDPRRREKRRRQTKPNQDLTSETETEGAQPKEQGGSLPYTTRPRCSRATRPSADRR